MTKEQLASLIVAAFDADESGASADMLESYQDNKDGTVFVLTKDGKNFAIQVEEM